MSPKPPELEPAVVFFEVGASLLRQQQVGLVGWVGSETKLEQTSNGNMNTASSAKQPNKQQNKGRMPAERGAHRRQNKRPLPERILWLAISVKEIQRVIRRVEARMCSFSEAPRCDD